MIPTASEHPAATTATEAATADRAGADGSTAPTMPSPPAPGLTPREVCPLCGQTLRSEQDWCLRCGAAARTRLAAPAKWKLLVLALIAIALLSIAVLVAALVKLAG